MAGRKRKGVKAVEAGANPEATPEVVAVTEAQAEEMAIQDQAVAVSDVGLPQAEETILVSSGELTVSLTPRVLGFLQRITARASADNLYTPEEAVADILEEWCTIYEMGDTGGIEHLCEAAVVVDEDPPEFAEMFEESVRS